MSTESAAAEVGVDVGPATELPYPLAKSKKQLELNIWQELRRRWLVFGIMFVVLLAVLAPNIGAPGGNYNA